MNTAIIHRRHQFNTFNIINDITILVPSTIFTSSSPFAMDEQSMCAFINAARHISSSHKLPPINHYWPEITPTTYRKSPTAIFWAAENGSWTVNK
jgi:hypothetical protein